MPQQIQVSSTPGRYLPVGATVAVLIIYFYHRRNKKKKIPLVNNEEVDMDLSAMDDSPVLWIRWGFNR
jgi:hypothetical protein